MTRYNRNSEQHTIRELLGASPEETLTLCIPKHQRFYELPEEQKEKLFSLMEDDEDEEEKEDRLMRESLILQIAQLDRKKAEREALKNILPKREERIKEIEKEQHLTQQKIEVYREQLTEIQKVIDELQIKVSSYAILITDVRDGKNDSELMESTSSKMEQMNKSTMENLSEQRGRERERAHTTTKKEGPERPRSKSPNLDGSRKIPPLWHMLQQPTEFKYYVYNPGVWCYAKTRRGDNIVYELDGEPRASKKLSGWIDTLEKHYNNGVNHRKIGVYDKKKEGPRYLHTQTNEWRRMADDVDEHTVIFNPKKEVSYDVNENTIVFNPKKQVAYDRLKEGKYYKDLQSGAWLKMDDDEGHPEGRERTREIKIRPPLHSVICQRTEFKTSIRGKEYYAYTDDGHTIIANGSTYATINKWTEATYKLIGFKNKTKRSVYECVLVFRKKENKYCKLGDYYDTSGQMLNPL
jgi:hypothetical protein